MRVERSENDRQKGRPIYRIDRGSEHRLFEGMKLWFYTVDISRNRRLRRICPGEIRRIERQSSVVGPEDKDRVLPEVGLIVITK